VSFQQTCCPCISVFVFSISWFASLVLFYGLTADVLPHQTFTPSEKEIRFAPVVQINFLPAIGTDFGHTQSPLRIPSD
jgi:hypothetical protein